VSGLKKVIDFTDIRRAFTLYRLKSQWQYSHEEAPLCQTLQFFNTENLVS